MRDVVLTQRFLPETGGSISWLYEVYRRWPRECSLITHDYADSGPGCELESGNFNLGSIAIQRADLQMKNWGLDSLHSLVRYGRMTRLVFNEYTKYKNIRVHCTHVIPEAASLLPLKFFLGKKLQIISYAHGEEITACQTSRQLTFLYKFTAKCVDKFIANSENTRKILEGFIENDNISVIYPGVDCAYFKGGDESAREARSKLGIGDDTLVLLTVGRLTQRKNHSAVLRAMGEIVSEFRELLYCIVGDGEELDNLKKLVAELNLKEHVVFLGEINEKNKQRVYRSADLFIMPAVQSGTDIEGFGIVFLEAAACGIPAISGNSGGQVEAVIDGETGYVIDGNNRSELVSALRKLLTDSPLRNSLGANAEKRAEEFDWNNVVNQTWDLVRK